MHTALRCSATMCAAKLRVRRWRPAAFPADRLGVRLIRVFKRRALNGQTGVLPSAASRNDLAIYENGNRRYNCSAAGLSYSAVR